MSFEIHIFEDLPLETQQYVANQVSDYTNGKLGEQPQMVPQQPEEIFGRQVGIIALNKGLLAGYIGAKNPEFHNGCNMSAVGSLCVFSEYRNNGLARTLIGVITIGLVELNQKPYARGNKNSMGIFKQIGYVHAHAQDVPPSALDACKICPNKPVDSDHCDNILVFRGNIQ